jgi:hypothetical protein
MRPSHVRTYLRLANEVVQIAAGSASAQLKYNLIFSEQYSKRLHGIMPLDYYDPDTSYEEDVYAYVRALEAQCEELRKAFPEF